MIIDIKDLTSFKWATVTTVSPLTIKMDGDTNPLALVPESLVDPMTLLVGDRVRVELSLRKCVIHGAANGGAQSGEIKITAATAAPRGWLLAQGQSLLRATYPRLFAALGTTYGAAGSTHFSLPDLRGRVVVGNDVSQAEFDVLGEKGGEKTHSLTSAELPSSGALYKEVILVPTSNIDGGGSSGTGTGNRAYMAAGGAPYTRLWQGGGGAHNNLQPYISLNYIIKV